MMIFFLPAEPLVIGSISGYNLISHILRTTEKTMDPLNSCGKLRVVFLRSNSLDSMKAHFGNSVSLYITYSCSYVIIFLILFVKSPSNVSGSPDLYCISL